MSLAAANLAASASLPSCWAPSDARHHTILSGFAMPTPLTIGHICPSRPELNLTPGVQWSSGCPGRPAWPTRYFLRCAKVT
eukprot:747323-Hanusia_phi.AAC.2